jgi:hypothetical protein
MGTFYLVLAAAVDAATINHSHVGTVTNLPQGTMDSIGRQRWFFSHASVGGNLIEGMQSLHGSHASRYQLNPYNIGTAGTFGGSDYRAAAAPSSSSTGRIYECYRENPPWQNKLVCFSNSLARSGWGTGKVDFVMDKFCWIDQEANANTYLTSLSRLEQMFTGVHFVYITMPLTGLSDGENDLRNAYNRTVRNYCALNGKLLFDLADMQAWTPGGVQQTYISGGVTNQRLYSGYAVNPAAGDWHMNAAGQQRLALGWYAVAASMASNFPTPLTFRAVALTNNVILRWSNPTNSGASTRYVHIRYATNAYPNTTSDGTSTYTGTNLSHEHTGLTPGQAYYYSIWISNDGVNYTNPP